MCRENFGSLRWQEVSTSKATRRLPVGAETFEGGGVGFRVWAPKRQQVRLVLASETLDLDPETNGYFSIFVEKARAGDLYRFRLDDDDYLYPDPASRFQPEGPHGPSQVIDPSAFRWTDSEWRGATPESQIVYEMHIGAFTAEGTWNSACECLEELADMGITMIELMPVADFNGRWGWGYDGVDLFAPTRLYGTPDEARAFVDRAHSLGLGVVLDVVYNHLGPDGNYLKSFAEEYFTDDYQNDWGEAIDFTSPPVREFYLANASYWIDEYHFDGLRLDATQDIHDPSEEHILSAIGKKVRAASGRRGSWIVAENEPQQSSLVRAAESGGTDLDALWNDDFHHSAMVRLTGRSEAYYTDYRGNPQEFVSAAKYGYLYQGQRYKWQKQRRGSPALDLDYWHFVNFIQNHDQVANTARGQRPNVLASPALYRAVSALFILMPGTPMLLQGQEYGASTPFFYFCDYEGELSDQVYEGRRKFLRQFRSLAQPEVQAMLVNPCDVSTFQQSKLDPAERRRNTALRALYKDLISLRRKDPVLRNPKRGSVDGAVLSPDAFLLRYFSQEHGDRLLLVNMGRDLQLDPAPEPLLAPPEKRIWSVLWSSEAVVYGGSGTFPPDSRDNWRLPGQSAMLMG